MLKMFNEKYKIDNFEVSYSSYYRIFKTCNLKFKQPSADTCATCDELVTQLKCVKTETEKIKLKEKHELHLRKADAAYQLKREMKSAAKDSESVRRLIFDLEQVFSTPSVTCGKAYYLRQLSVYNLTIVDSKTNVTSNYMWHKGEAGRGATEIASCLYKHFMDEVPNTVTHVNLCSDCCTGQNRNSIIAGMFQIVLALHPSIKQIDHVFLVPGHTRLECDSRHSRIEAKKNKAGLISVPSGWYELVSSVGEKYNVI
ncbi:hypothetical protein ONE63_005062 [Megalurothrips usitatus]|uniref:Uncharacterized protein n=1 Tax=Megalurothrips usitatus TaxID=439358 RepID=A0AAV7X759_9NEOP|nr:hypothetical protein ONE63_005062 [Megalurothrips usitatus]